MERAHQGLGGSMSGELLLNGYKVSVWGNENNLEINARIIHLKMVKMSICL